MNSLKIRENKFKALSNWHVITGAPCSGKTTTINELNRRGHRTIGEVTRTYIEQELEKGKTLEQIRADEHEFQQRTLYTKIEIESRLPRNETIFFDRGIPDSIAYYRLKNLDPAQPLECSFLTKYKTVFMMEPLPFENDPVRSENSEEALQLHHLIKDAYCQLGYDLITLPPCPVSKRVALILNRIS